MSLHSRFMPRAIRPDFLAISYFYSEMQKILVNSRESSLALGKLDYWKKSIDKIYDVT